MTLYRIDLKFEKTAALKAKSKPKSAKAGARSVLPQLPTPVLDQVPAAFAEKGIFTVKKSAITHADSATQIEIKDGDTVVALVRETADHVRIRIFSDLLEEDFAEEEEEDFAEEEDYAPKKLNYLLATLSIAMGGTSAAGAATGVRLVETTSKVKSTEVEDWQEKELTDLTTEVKYFNLQAVLASFAQHYTRIDDDNEIEVYELNPGVQVEDFASALQQLGVSLWDYPGFCVQLPPISLGGYRGTKIAKGSYCGKNNSGRNWQQTFQLLRLGVALPASNDDIAIIAKQIAKQLLQDGEIAVEERFFDLSGIPDTAIDRLLDILEFIQEVNKELMRKDPENWQQHKLSCTLDPKTYLTHRARINDFISSQLQQAKNTLHSSNPAEPSQWQQLHADIIASLARTDVRIHHISTLDNLRQAMQQIVAGVASMTSFKDFCELHKLMMKFQDINYQDIKIYKKNIFGKEVVDVKATKKLHSDIQAFRNLLSQEFGVLVDMAENELMADAFIKPDTSEHKGEIHRDYRDDEVYALDVDLLLKIEGALFAIDDADSKGKGDLGLPLEFYADNSKVTAEELRRYNAFLMAELELAKFEGTSRVEAAKRAKARFYQEVRPDLAPKGMEPQAAASQVKSPAKKTPRKQQGPKDSIGVRLAQFGLKPRSSSQGSGGALSSCDSKVSTESSETSTSASSSQQQMAAEEPAAKVNKSVSSGGFKSMLRRQTYGKIETSDS